MQPTDEATKAYAQAPRVTRRIQVPVVTLDELVDGQSISLLKLDVQGAEIKVIAGGYAALKATTAILVEANDMPHYEDGSTFADVDQELTTLGFALWDVAAPARTLDGRALWADMCYARVPA